ncbi:DUF7504 family protein [Halorussus amylolyticus]|uniref:DUF7504 family protein n=1 Tax=Halorussus amylolyticus TaxID=1126242 RepID=UPI00138F375F|nr:hypothetical protein [Halorussus amylolyticus]
MGGAAGRPGGASRAPVATDSEERDSDTSDPAANDSDKSDSGDRIFRTEIVETADLRDLGVAIEESVAAFEAKVDHVSPAELRVCFDSLAPVVAGYDDRDARRFLLGVTEVVERAGGMGHYHLPGDPDAETVESLSALFDAVVEVRRGDEGVEQRWRLDDIETEWLAL